MKRVLSLLLSTALLSCSSDSGGGTTPTPGGTSSTTVITDTSISTTTLPSIDLSKVKVQSVKIEGDFNVAISLEGEGSDLNLVWSSIKHPEDQSKPIILDEISFTLEGFYNEVRKSSFECTTEEMGTKTAPVDVTFLIDTTGSMGGTGRGIAQSIEDFAQNLLDKGIDARFSIFTYGDAFATRSSFSEFDTSNSNYETTELDNLERPFMDFSDLTSLKAFLNTLVNSSVLENGGGDGPENTLGVLTHSLKQDFRDGALRQFVVIGDSPSHTVNSLKRISDYREATDSKFLPTDAKELLNNIKGTTTLHVIGNDHGVGLDGLFCYSGHGEEGEKTCYEATTSNDYFNLKVLADETGGAFIELPYDGLVDLTTLKVDNWMTSGFVGTCTASEVFNVIKGTITITTSTKTYTANVEVVITLE